ncbi:IclR family transcriptional regulator [Sphingobium phenoxybenzoativorans]|uniref:IclR family transcriptional regulator n=1 Tax=Sphingobium phenoxybenzoativorans TaxID=1592790 RepID=UPI0009F1E181|nr:IclR family transcriptional regulator [Sphingobium phenoxybenzoativorans]
MTESSDASGKIVPAVRRAIAILRLLADAGGPLNLSQIARGADIVPSTALHILRELAAARLITTESNQKTYRLGTGLLELAQAVVRRTEFADIARPLLQDIARRFDVTAMATAALDPDHSACVASVSPSHSMSLNVTVGGRVPTLSGAAGRCVAAFSPTPLPELRKRFSRIRWQTPFDFETWLGQVEQVRQFGYAEDDGLFARGVTTLAAPVFNPDGTVTKAVGIASISAALEMDRREAIADALKTSADIISRQMAD